MPNAEIDALLVSELYGELTPTEAARLAELRRTGGANIEAAEALPDLGGLRSLLREAAEDPSPRLRQQLLQASQAAVAADEQSLTARLRAGWARLTELMIGHPALAAAATLALVGGTAGLWYAQTGGRVTLPAASDVAVVADQKATQEAPSAGGPSSEAVPSGAARGQADKGGASPADGVVAQLAEPAAVGHSARDEGRSTAKGAKEGEAPAAKSMVKEERKTIDEDLAAVASPSREKSAVASKKSTVSNSETAIGWMKDDSANFAQPPAMPKQAAVAPGESDRAALADEASSNALAQNGSESVVGGSRAMPSAAASPAPKSDAALSNDSNDSYAKAPTDPLSAARAALSRGDCGAAQRAAQTALATQKASAKQVAALPWTAACPSSNSDSKRAAPAKKTSSKPAPPTTAKPQ